MAAAARAVSQPLTFLPFDTHEQNFRVAAGLYDEFHGRVVEQLSALEGLQGRVDALNEKIRTFSGDRETESAKWVSSLEVLEDEYKGLVPCIVDVRDLKGVVKEAIADLDTMITDTPSKERIKLYTGVLDTFSRHQVVRERHLAVLHSVSHKITGFEQRAHDQLLTAAKALVLARNSFSSWGALLPSVGNPRIYEDTKKGCASMVIQRLHEKQATLRPSEDGPSAAAFREIEEELASDGLPAIMDLLSPQAEAEKAPSVYTEMANELAEEFKNTHASIEAGTILLSKATLQIDQFSLEAEYRGGLGSYDVKKVQEMRDRLIKLLDTLTREDADEKGAFTKLGDFVRKIDTLHEMHQLPPLSSEVAAYTKIDPAFSEAIVSLDIESRMSWESTHAELGEKLSDIRARVHAYMEIAVEHKIKIEEEIGILNEHLREREPLEFGSAEA